MLTSTTRNSTKNRGSKENKKSKESNKSRRRDILSIRLLSIAFWLLVWHLAALALNQSILLVSPLRVAERLSELIGQGSFWQAIGNSLGRIAQGFFAAAGIGVLLAIAAQNALVAMLINPPLALIKATPVASFTILVLFWIPARNLAVIISFLMVLPIIFFNVFEGLQQVDHKLLEMARVFKVPLSRRLRAIYLPSVLPYFTSACNIGLGQAWKSGIAAEVIALPNQSIGINLYNAKVYLENADLLAWTVVIVLLSLTMEQLFLWLVNRFR